MATYHLQRQGSFFVLRLSQESDPFSAILLQCFPLHCPHRRTCMHTSCIMLKNDQSKESSFEFWPQWLIGNSCRWGKMGGVKVELWEATFCQKNCRIIFRKSLNIAAIYCNPACWHCTQLSQAALATFWPPINYWWDHPIKSNWWVRVRLSGAMWLLKTLVCPKPQAGVAACRQEAQLSILSFWCFCFYIGVPLGIAYTWNSKPYYCNINETCASPATMKHFWGLKDQRMIWKANLEFGMLLFT